MCQTFISNTLSFKPGQTVFSDVTLTKMAMPPGRICIVGTGVEVANATGDTVPYDEVYNHHCDLYNYDRPNDMWDASEDSVGICKNTASFVFHEAHYSRVRIPAFKGTQFCWNTEPDSYWGMNVHLMYLKNIDPNKHGGIKGM